ncbi:hypothetical protein [Vibrio vulnificus]|uniref:hypothetical protein n=1 Tax=Vibrio vulnificus TaxID=672 RepID=UPI00188AB6E4|nr:hypothetical protein [Vibrio vulnificus]EJO9868633.1 hypothetical protein [Vibrio vulnificus]MBF4453570.1 hypothetical protein [Vibrio vulnificus]MBF4499268.1 hypothetical protein [Vibrio vulnificus]MBL6179000.1 hypothetical protein [Vibrio vulnificus]HDY7983573.1 hypothetical protein [Vibrio vulnificus]
MKLDFNLATKVEHGYLLIPEPAKELAEFPDVYERICSVIYHCTMVSDEPVKQCISSSAKDATHIRSALCEFVGIEDLLKQLYPKLCNKVFAIYKSENPILHMIKLLRNYNVHISNSQLSQKSMKVRTKIDNFREIDITVEYISNLSLDSLKLMRSANNYSDSQLTRMIEVFECEQHEFGVTTLILKAVIDYSQHLAKVLHSNQAS